MLGGSCSVASDSAVLMTPPAPAAMTMCPTLLLSEPMRQKPMSWVLAAERPRQPFDLDRVAQRRGRAVRFDVARCCAGRRPLTSCAAGDHGGLAVDAGRREAGLVASVVVDGHAADHGVDRVAVGEGVAQPLEQHHRRAVAEHRALRLARRSCGCARPATASSLPGTGSRCAAGR